MSRSVEITEWGFLIFWRMDMRLYRYFAMILVALSFTIAGCQTGPVDEKVPVASSAIEANVRKTLEEFESTGQTGSALTSLESDINGIRTTDPAKADALKKGFLELQQASTPEQVQAAAKEMLSKL